MRISRREFLQVGASVGAAALLLGTLSGSRLHPQTTEAASLFDRLLTPFVSDVGNRRKQRLEGEPEYSGRIDPELNAGRVNFLLFGYGQTYEPPFQAIDLIGSHTIFSYDLGRNVFDLVSITHDTRAPEIERFMTAKGNRVLQPAKIDRAYFVGGRGEEGLNLQRRVLESATGLSVDYQVVFGDDAIVDLIGELFGKIKVQVPKTFSVNPVYFKNVRYPTKEFRAGVQELSGVEAVQFIKGVVIEEDLANPDPQLEHNVRKPLVVAAVLDGVNSNAPKLMFWAKAVAFLNNAINARQIVYDFDPAALLIRGIKDLALSLLKSPFDQTEMSVMPKTGRQVYIVDARHGDGGVGWALGSLNPIIRDEVERGFYADPNVEMPIDGNPYTPDLVKDYWAPVRTRVKDLLSVDR